MAKVKTIYVCRNCGADSPKWIGRCPSCNEWNTYVEEKIVSLKSSFKSNNEIKSAKPVSINEIQPEKLQRVDSSIGEFNRLLGGGIVPGSLILLGGEPGIGKSTLALQIALNTDKKVLYVSGEESQEQLKLRAERLSYSNKNCLVYCEVNFEQVINQIEQVNPDILIIDSIQTLYTESIDTSPGSISQIRECASRLLKIAKTTHIPIFLIGHITKDGMLAGPKILEHIVDTVLQFEGDHQHVYRILRALKNRFGSTSELAIFEMNAKGLHEIKNPSEVFLTRSDENPSGVAIASTVDGVRPFLIECQALVSTAVYGTPQRTSTGFDTRRLNMLLAVLEKKAGFKLATKDVFLNITGGIKVQDTAIDLAVASAILSSNFDRAIDANICMTAEISLTGELKPVMRLEQRIAEASRLGFKKIIIPKYTKGKFDELGKKIQLIPCAKIEEAVRIIFKS
ncbi:MAG: DNA repair protein RadA [Bacteroidales bacterium]|nr:DNA repair protein RadA [Bacteroidales bacterium]